MRTNVPLLTKQEVAAKLRVSQATVTRMLARHELPGAFRLGGLPGRPLRFRRADLEQALAGWTEQVR
jgi:excisionase family DNA binding protein